MAKETPLIPGNMKLNVREVIDGGTTPTVNYYATYPEHFLAISLDKKSETAKLEVTTDALLNDGSKLSASSLSNSSIIWQEVSASGTDNYFKGDSRLITGIKLTTQESSNVQISLTQVND